jgi:3-dehydroquinate synthase
MRNPPIRTVVVGGEFEHDVLVGAGLLDVAGQRLAAWEWNGATRVLLVVDANVTAHADRVEASFRSSGHATARVILEASESRKSMGAVEAIWSAALSARLTRQDLIVAVGGGLVGDVAGFAAATFQRGVRWLAVPTTLLAMVDASTGGKTGINLVLPGGDLGKNLAGSFWPPVEVLADPETLATLPSREFQSGLAECIKHAIIDGEDHVAWLERLLPAIAPGVSQERLVSLTELVARSVSVKAKIVTEDPRERGIRAVLNLGHTFGHAFETDPRLDLTHGEAVAVGIMAACQVGEELRGFADRKPRSRPSHLSGLPTSLPRGVPVADIEARMGFDKKSEGGSLRFVVPRAFGRVEPKVEVPPGVVRGALLAVGCEA